MSQTQPQTQAPQTIWDQIEQAKKSSGKFMKIPVNEKAILQFNVNKIAIVDSSFEGKLTGGKSVEYTVIEPRVNPQLEKVLSISVGKTDNINAMLKKGISLLEVQKLGSGKEAKYIATPV